MVPDAFGRQFYLFTGITAESLLLNAGMVSFFRGRMKAVFRQCTDAGISVCLLAFPTGRIRPHSRQQPTA